MKESSNYIGEERRKYYRLAPSLPQPLRADIYLTKGEPYAVEVVNVSPGGLLCYAAAEQCGFAVGQPIQRIDIFFPNKKPVHYSGVIRRLQPSQQQGRYFCAIEFTKISRKGEVLGPSKDASLQRKVNEVATTPGAEFLHRVRRIENYTKCRDAKKEIEIRLRAYKSFSDISAILPTEERWWFFEILDEMKRREPDYPEGLKREFLKLCRGGSFRNIYRRDHRKRFSKMIKSLLRIP